ncbi:MAG TPA: hypothetical protein DCX14_12760 [Flavobacteriales bacterium]|nr:hypothetical protein [Flavobacteriales bacterium]
MDFFLFNKLQVIIHLGALNNIDRCEQHHCQSLEMNYMLTRRLVAICELLKIKMIFLSSDYVLAGCKLNADEFSSPRPMTIYARDKARSEALIQSSLNSYAIIRTSQVFGVDGDFVQLVLTAARKQREFQAWSNLANCPTYINDLCNLILQVLENELSGVFHCSGGDVLSRYEFAKLIAQVFDLKELTIHPVSLANDNVRPRHVVLSCEDTLLRTGISLTKTNDALTAIRDGSIL